MRVAGRDCSFAVPDVSQSDECSPVRLLPAWGITPSQSEAFVVAALVAEFFTYLSYAELSFVLNLQSYLP
jgi:hypothetical protein